MTTIRDVLNDLIQEVIALQDVDDIDEDQVEELLDTYTDVIKERIVG